MLFGMFGFSLHFSVKPACRHPLHCVYYALTVCLCVCTCVRERALASVTMPDVGIFNTFSHPHVFPHCHTLPVHTLVSVAACGAGSYGSTDCH